jgi:4-hydroxybenzoate polyprenyltransferase
MRTLYGFFRLVHPFPSLLVTAVTVGLVPMASHDASLGTYFALGFGMLLFQFSIGAANDAADAPADTAAGRAKPIPSGLVSPLQARLAAALFAGAGLAVTMGLGTVPWLVGLAGLSCGLAYDLVLKGTVLSWLPWCIAFPLIPAWVWSATGEWEPLLWWVLPCGFLLGLAAYLANQAPDIEGDRASGVEGLAQGLGTVAARRLAVGAFGLAASCVVAVLLVVSEPTRAMAAALVAFLALMLSMRAPMLFGRSGLFGVIATSSGLLALVFLSAA